MQTKTNGGEWKLESNLQTPKGDEKLEMKVTGLTEDDKIQFRTIAVNAAGESEPSDPAPVPPHVVKHRNSKFFVQYFWGMKSHFYNLPLGDFNFGFRDLIKWKVVNFLIVAI